MTRQIGLEEAQQWLARYGEAWEKRDPSLAGALFTPDATYRETPFDAPFEGRDAIEDYWARAVAGQRDVRFSAEVLACAGDQAIAHWHVEFTAVPGDARVELDGIFILAFHPGGLVNRFEEWWHVRP